MKLSIEFSTDNAAFEDDFSLSCFEILDGISQDIVGGWRSGKIKDWNGNTIGAWSHE